MYPRLLQHVQRIADAVGGQVEELGEFHDADRFVVSYGTGHLQMAADQFSLVLHLFEHSVSSILRIAGIIHRFFIHRFFYPVVREAMPWSPGIFSGN